MQRKWVARRPLRLPVGECEEIGKGRDKTGPDYPDFSPFLLMEIQIRIRLISSGTGMNCMSLLENPFCLSDL